MFAISSFLHCLRFYLVPIPHRKWECVLVTGTDFGTKQALYFCTHSQTSWQLVSSEKWLFSNWLASGCEGLLAVSSWNWMQRGVCVCVQAVETCSPSWTAPCRTSAISTCCWRRRRSRRWGGRWWRRGVAFAASCPCCGLSWSVMHSNCLCTTQKDVWSSNQSYAETLQAFEETPGPPLDLYVYALLDVSSCDPNVNLWRTSTPTPSVLQLSLQTSCGAAAVMASVSKLFFV